MHYCFSSRISALSPSPTLTLNARAAELKKQGKPIISFAVGEPDYDTPAAVVEEAIKGLRAGKTRYGVSGGGLALRQAIADKLKRENNLVYSPEEIVVGMGAKEILFHTFLALLNPGDEVVVFSPYWVSYADQVIAAGGVPVVIPPPQDFPQRSIDISAMSEYLTAKTKAIIVNSPNNPAGYVLTRSELVELGNALTHSSAWIISDEIYEYLVFTGKHNSLLEVHPELRDRFVLINGLSKSFAMTGWRVGYAAVPRELANLLRTIQSQSSTSIPGFIEAAACYAVTQGLPLVSKQVASLKERCAVSYPLLATIPGLKLVCPGGAFYFLVGVEGLLPIAGCTTSFALCEYLLAKHHLALVPGEAFGAPGFVRLSYTLPLPQLREGLARFKAALMGRA